MQILKTNIDNSVTLLSSISKVFKTGLFDEKTNSFTQVDAFVYKLAEGVFANRNHFKQGSYKVDAAGKCFYFKIGVESHFGIGKDDIVFFDFEGDSAVKNDITLIAALRAKSLYVTFSDNVNTFCDLTRVYKLTFNDSVNFPLLSQKQRQIVQTEDKNIVVQGVAGSGKTNVCIDKIVFSAFRGYVGKLLYTTFSRGLLIDTQSRVNAFSAELKSYAADFAAGKIKFADSDHKRAVENKLGVVFSVDGDKEIAKEAERIAGFLDNRVDYMLIEDLYKTHIEDKDATDEAFFLKNFLSDVKDHRLKSRLASLKQISYEIIFKEIYGFITGRYVAGSDIIAKEVYIAQRNGFERKEAETIYEIAVEYAKYLYKTGGQNNNTMSRALIANADSIEKYSLAIIDEVQDMTEVNLVMFKAISRKMFCVGDAMQMINPSFFSFAFLKRLLFEKEVANVAELTNNFRSTKLIAEITDSLSELNVKRFGTHSFVMKSEAVGKDKTEALYINDLAFLNTAASADPDDATFIVSGVKSKEKLRRVLKRQEILTVSEAKGLERDNVILVELLSDNYDKWQAMERAEINRKTADENSVYRYYFNLFYVGLTRARRNLFVYESKSIDAFTHFFDDNFAKSGAKIATQKLIAAAGSGGADRERTASRIEEFIKLGQYDNARFAAEKIEDGALRARWMIKIDIYEKHTAHGRYREAGIALWKSGIEQEAREMFELSDDKALIQLMDAVAAGGGGLSADAVRYYVDLQDNNEAQQLIISTLIDEVNDSYEKQKVINQKLSNYKRTK